MCTEFVKLVLMQRKCNMTMFDQIHGLPLYFFFLIELNQTAQNSCFWKKKEWQIAFHIVCLMPKMNPD